MLSALMNQASDLLQQTRDRLNASAAGLSPTTSSSLSEKPERAIPAISKSEGEGALDRFERNATTLRLSARARLQDLSNDSTAQGSGSTATKGPAQGNLGQAVSAAIDELRNQLTQAFSKLGLDQSQAAAAADAARDAVAGATRSESFQLQLSRISAQETSIRESDGDSYYGASLVAEQLEVSYDAESGTFRASVVRVSISVEIGTGDFADDVGAGTLLNADGERLKLDELLEGIFFNGLQLAKGEKDRAVAESQADAVEDDGSPTTDAASLSTDRETAEVGAGGDSGGSSPLILISTPNSGDATGGADIHRNFRVDLLLRIAQPEPSVANLPPEHDVGSTGEPSSVRPEPVDIIV